MVKTLSLKQKALMSLYRLGAKRMGAHLVFELPKRSAEWVEVIREVLADPESEHREEVLGQLMQPGFVEGHPFREALVESIESLLTDGIGEECRLAIEFATRNLHFFATGSDSLQAKLIGLQHSRDAVMANAAEELLAKMGIDMRDPALLGDRHDALFV